MSVLKKGVVSKYSFSLSKIKQYITNEYNPNNHIRYMKIGIWHFDTIKARYFIAVNPIFVSLAAFSNNLVYLLIMDAVILLTLCILLGLSTHDDSKTEGEGIL